MEDSFWANDDFSNNFILCHLAINFKMESEYYNDSPSFGVLLLRI